ncbi:MAG: hypothetical protein ACOCQR_00590 [bacterium]
MKLNNDLYEMQDLSEKQLQMLNIKIHENYRDIAKAYFLIIFSFLGLHKLYVGKKKQACFYMVLFLSGTLLNSSLFFNGLNFSNISFVNIIGFLMLWFLFTLSAVDLFTLSNQVSQYNRKITVALIEIIKQESQFTSQAISRLKQEKNDVKKQENKKVKKRKKEDEFEKEDLAKIDGVKISNNEEEKNNFKYLDSNHEENNEKDKKDKKDKQYVREDNCKEDLQDKKIISSYEKKKHILSNNKKLEKDVLNNKSSNERFYVTELLLKK